MTNVTIKVDTEVLVTAANNFQDQGNSIASITSQMMDLVIGLGNQWIGEASNAYISRFKMLEDDIYRMANKITEFVEDLITISNVYNTFEETSMDEVNALETDVIF